MHKHGYANSRAHTHTHTHIHSHTQYFAVGKIQKDQVVNYAARKKMDLETCERWLAPMLGYDRD